MTDRVVRRLLMHALKIERRLEKAVQHAQALEERLGEFEEEKAKSGEDLS